MDEKQEEAIDDSECNRDSGMRATLLSDPKFSNINVCGSWTDFVASLDDLWDSDKVFKMAEK